MVIGAPINLNALLLSLTIAKVGGDHAASYTFIYRHAFGAVTLPVVTGSACVSGVGRSSAPERRQSLQCTSNSSKAGREYSPPPPPLLRRTKASPCIACLRRTESVLALVTLQLGARPIACVNRCICDSSLSTFHPLPNGGVTHFSSSSSWVGETSSHYCYYYGNNSVTKEQAVRVTYSSVLEGGTDSLRK